MDKLNKNKLICGKKYYIWELIYNDQIIVAHNDVRDLVERTRKTVNKYVNGFLMVSAVFLLVSYIRMSSR